MTTKEVTDYLDQQSRLASDEQRCGDMTPTLLDAARIIVERDAALGERIDAIIASIRNATDPSSADFIAMVEALRPKFDWSGMPV